MAQQTSRRRRPAHIGVEREDRARHVAVGNSLEHRRGEAGQLGVQGQVGAATDLASASGQGAMGLGQAYANMATNPGAVGAYMNPYLMNALAPQMNLLQQQQGIQANQLASQASKAGAFGGSRYGIEQGLQNQANQLAMSNLVGQGFNTAYQNAMNQFNQDQARQLQAQQLGEQSRQFGANLGLQGAQAGIQGASQLAGIGGQQLAAQQGIIGLQNQMGAQQQAYNQQVINQAIQDYANAQQYPLLQLGTMSNMLRGLPMQATTTQQYQAQPGFGQQALGYGLGALGAYKAFS